MAHGLQHYESPNLDLEIKTHQASLSAGTRLNQTVSPAFPDVGHLNVHKLSVTQLLYAPKRHLTAYSGPHLTGVKGAQYVGGPTTAKTEAE